MIRECESRLGLKCECHTRPGEPRSRCLSNMEIDVRNAMPVYAINDRQFCDCTRQPY